MKQGEVVGKTRQLPPRESDNLMDGNVVIIITPEGDVIFQNPKGELTDEQLSAVTAISVVIEPSYFLSFVLILEILSVYLNIQLKKLWDMLIGKNRDG